MTELFSIAFSSDRLLAPPYLSNRLPCTDAATQGRHTVGGKVSGCVDSREVVRLGAVDGGWGCSYQA